MDLLEHRRIRLGEVPLLEHRGPADSHLRLRKARLDERRELRRAHRIVLVALLTNVS